MTQCEEGKRQDRKIVSSSKDWRREGLRSRTQNSIVLLSISSEFLFAKVFAASDEWRVAFRLIFYLRLIKAITNTVNGRNKNFETFCFFFKKRSQRFRQFQRNTKEEYKKKIRRRDECQVNGWPEKNNNTNETREKKTTFCAHIFRLGHFQLKIRAENKFFAFLISASQWTWNETKT